MKKIIPIVTMLGASSLIVGLSLSPVEEKKENYINNINAFQNEVSKYASVNNTELTTTALNKYTLSFQDNLTDLNQNLSNVSETETNESEKILNNNSETTIENDFENIDNETINQETSKLTEEISTLYSLSSDIESSCEDFCELKEDISEAIIETQNLINKVQQKEIELTSEQRMFITEQAQQLKNLGRQLSNITTELSFNLSDLNQIMTTNNQNIDNLSLKYLVVLDNLVNGNEMLQSGLTSLNLINQMFNMNTKNIPSNNQGRVLYGFRHNNNPPIIKDYYIDENGNMVENNQENPNNSIEENQTDTENAQPVVEDNKINIDTYKNTKLYSNLDTYNNRNLPNNIDSFFNTALLDNEFMYGNGGYGYGMNGMYGVNNPYINEYSNQRLNNSTNSGNNIYNTQDNVIKEKEKQSKRETKKIKLKKNIDTFKDENEPDIKTKLGNIKNSISGFFKKFKKTDLDDKVQNPIYRFDAQDLNN